MEVLETFLSPLASVVTVLLQMWPPFSSSLYPHPLQYDFATLSIKRCCVFRHPLPLSWPCDLLCPAKHAGSDTVPVLSPGLRQPCPLLLVLLELCSAPFETVWRVLLEDRRPQRAELSHPSQGHSRPANKQLTWREPQPRETELLRQAQPPSAEPSANPQN